ncbi:Arylsulfatase regulator [Candidatus Rhodobacter oscarellae]|uniref:Arylsulfatase regulator n=2 Tax=Candidatus Rhodobacter oscarellae TaxID=1675527 RepID=A0A0J9E3G4_9RHOB|nr:Arylsulfatase regulator [Candidatus Rhodobacter lobularis]
MLLFNSRTRNLQGLTAEEAVQFSKIQALPNFLVKERTPVLNTLYSDGFLVESHRDELLEVGEDYFSARNDDTSMGLTIAPSMGCNLACGYCFQGLNKDNEKMDRQLPDAIREVVAAKIYDLNSLSVTWYGGEPLMGKQAIFDISDDLMAMCDMHGVNYSASIVTNGFLLSPRISKRLHAARVDFAQITIDGLKKTHDRMRPLTSGRGSYETIMHNIETSLNQSPMHIQVRINVGAENIDEVPDLIDEFIAQGFDQYPHFSVYCAPIHASTTESGEAFDMSVAKADFTKKMIAVERKARAAGLMSEVAPSMGFDGLCVAATKNGLVITQNGDVHKCWETAHDPKKRVGSVYNMEDVDKSPTAKIWDEWTPFTSETCRSCKILPMCGGFCGHKFVYNGAGDEFNLPCPDWKWRTAEYVFERAMTHGAVEEDQWLPEETTETACQSGARHTMESLKASQDEVIERVNRVHGFEIDRDFLLNGDIRDWEKENLTREDQKADQVELAK